MMGLLLPIIFGRHTAHWTRKRDILPIHWCCTVLEAKKIYSGSLSLKEENILIDTYFETCWTVSLSTFFFLSSFTYGIRWIRHGFVAKAPLARDASTYNVSDSLPCWVMHLFIIFMRTASSHTMLCDPPALAVNALLLICKYVLRYNCISHMCADFSSNDVFK